MVTKKHQRIFFFFLKTVLPPFWVFLLEKGQIKSLKHLRIKCYVNLYYNHAVIEPPRVLIRMSSVAIHGKYVRTNSESSARSDACHSMI